jgi:hypothetical protein
MPQSDSGYSSGKHSGYRVVATPVLCERGGFRCNCAIYTPVAGADCIRFNSDESFATRDAALADAVRRAKAEIERRLGLN